MALGGIPVGVDPGYERAVTLQEEPRLRLLFYPSGAVRFEHLCKSATRTVVCAPALPREKFNIESLDPVTLNPSIECPDCHIHGYVRSGSWVRA